MRKMFKKYLKIYPGISCFLFHTTFTAHTRPIEPNTGENTALPLAATKNKRHPLRMRNGCNFPGM